MKFQPTNGIWVPEGTFTWGYTNTATATLKKNAQGQIVGASYKFKTTPPAKGSLKVSIDHTAWPTWKGLAETYRNVKPIPKK